MAVSGALQCDGRVTVHVDAAIKHGATHQDVVEELRATVAVNVGAALVHSARVMDAYAAHEEP